MRDTGCPSLSVYTLRELMHQQGRQDRWTNMVGQRPELETNNDAPRPQLSESLLDGEKTAAALLLSGVLLAMVGVTFTSMGWQYYQANLSFQWTQLLGPILISVGGTFLLTSVCKLRFLSCCRQQEEEVYVIPVREQGSGGHPVVVRSINSPEMLPSAAAMLCIPPTYSFITQELYQGNQLQPGTTVSGVNTGPPTYDTVCCAGNAGFTAEDSAAHTSQTGQRISRIQKTEREQGRLDESNSTCRHPPAYEELFPSSQKHNPT
nr:transmembrane protein 174 [Nothobranchius furzeri]